MKLKHMGQYLVSGSLALALGMGLVACSGAPAAEESISEGDAQNTPEATVLLADEAAGTVGGRYVGVEWLKDNLDKVTVLDARSAGDYATQHIPGAVNLHWTDTSNVAVPQGEQGWAEVADASALKAALGRAGVDGDKPVVIYTDPQDGWGEDGRMLWTLQQAGVEDAYILDGGWPQWLFKQGAHESSALGEANTTIAQVDTAFVKQETGKAKLVDARGADEYAGELTMGEARMGHIPGAVSLPSVDMYEENGMLKSEDDLRKLASDAGLSQNDEIIVYCTGGVRAANVAEALSALGFQDVSVYTAGFSEWAGDPSNPVE